MTTETLLDTEVEPPEGGQPVGDAGLQSADAAAAIAQDQEAASPEDAKAFEEEADAYLASRSKEGTKQATESTPVRTAQAESDTEAALYKAFSDQHLTNYRSRMAWADGRKDELVDAGWTETQADRFVKDLKDKINEEHADSIRLSGRRAADLTEKAVHDYYQKAIDTGLESSLPKKAYETFITVREEAKAKDGSMSWPLFWSTVVEQSRNGFVSEKDHEAGIRQAWLDGRRAREKAGEVEGAAAGQEVNGRRAPTYGAMSLDEIEKMPTAEWLAKPASERERILNQAHEVAARRR